MNAYRDLDWSEALDCNESCYAAMSVGYRIVIDIKMRYGIMIKSRKISCIIKGRDLVILLLMLK